MDVNKPATSFADVSYEEAMRRAHELIPFLREQAPQCEAIGRLTPVVMDTLHRTGLLRYLGRHRWWVCAAVALGAAGFNWLVFAHWLHVPLPEGMLWIF